jgi:hypothetical protein
MSASPFQLLTHPLLCPRLFCAGVGRGERSRGRPIREGQEGRQSTARLIDLAKVKAKGGPAATEFLGRSRVSGMMTPKVRRPGEPPPVYGKCGLRAID